jgi:hypothetical protein
MLSQSQTLQEYCQTGSAPFLVIDGLSTIRPERWKQTSTPVNECIALLAEIERHSGGARAIRSAEFWPGRVAECELREES